MFLDLFVYKSDKGKDLPLCSARVGDKLVIDTLRVKILEQGGPADFPILLNNLLGAGFLYSGEIPVSELEAFQKEIQLLKGRNSELRRFKKSIKLVCEAALESQRPIVF